MRLGGDQVNQCLHEWLKNSPVADRYISLVMKKITTSISYKAVLDVATANAETLRHYLPVFPEQAVMAVSWASALHAVYGMDSYGIACAAKWPIKTNEELGDDLLAGRPAAGYFGYYATPEELAFALVEKKLPEQLHYCVGISGNRIFDPWCSDVMEDYTNSTGNEWHESLRLPEYIMGQPDDLRITKDYHYDINLQVSAAINAIISSLANHLR